MPSQPIKKSPPLGAHESYVLRLSATTKLVVSVLCPLSPPPPSRPPKRRDQSTPRERERVASPALTLELVSHSLFSLESLIHATTRWLLSPYPRNNRASGSYLVHSGPYKYRACLSSYRYTYSRLAIVGGLAGTICNVRFINTLTNILFVFTKFTTSVIGQSRTCTKFMY